MVRKLFSLLLALVIVVVGTVKPAYAVSDSSSLLNSYSTDFLAAITSEDLMDEAAKTAVDVVVTTGTWIAICYGADALATSVFPPAAAVAPFCPVIAGGTATAVGAVKAFAK